MNQETRIAHRETAEDTLAVKARDNRLVSRTLAGDGEAYDDLVRIYYDRLRALVYHHLHREEELDDALQEIFLKAYQALPRFKKRSNFYTWLYRIASNFCIDSLRKRRLETISLDGTEARDALEARLPLSPDSPEESFNRSQRVELVRTALAKLDPIYQNILVLRELEGLSYEEITESLGIGMGTVKSRIARARAELKQILLEMGAI